MNSRIFQHILPWMTVPVMVICLMTGFSSPVSSKTYISVQKDNPRYNLNVIDAEITRLSEDIQWLRDKITRFQRDGRFIPDDFHTSLRLKEKRRTGLIRLKEKYAAMAPAVSSQKKAGAVKVVKKKDLKTKETVRPAVTKDALMEKINRSGLSEWIELVEDRDLLKIENALPILFASGSADIAEEYQVFFKGLADLVKDYDVRIIVDGYADKDPIRTPKYPSNFELGAARAANVVHALTRQGIKPEVFKIGSTGRHRFVSQKPSEWKALERFVDITILFRS